MLFHATQSGNTVHLLYKNGVDADDYKVHKTKFCSSTDIKNIASFVLRTSFLLSLIHILFHAKIETTRRENLRKGQICVDRHDARIFLYSETEAYHRTDTCVSRL